MIWRRDFCYVLMTTAGFKKTTEKKRKMKDSGAVSEQTEGAFAFTSLLLPFLVEIAFKVV